MKIVIKEIEINLKWWHFVLIIAVPIIILKLAPSEIVSLIENWMS